jgi:hypothetical protein
MINMKHTNTLIAALHLLSSSSMSNIILYLDNTLKMAPSYVQMKILTHFFLCLNLNSGLFALYMFMHFSGFENWGVGVAKLTLNLQFDCFVTHLHMFSCLFSFEFDLNFR